MHMYATLSMGGASLSHKKVEASRSWVLYQYYHSKVGLVPGGYEGYAKITDRPVRLLRAQ